MEIGYMRVSTGDQNPDAQRDALIRAGVAEENIYVDHTSGAKSSRPQWDVVNKVLRAGDVLVCTRLDRVGRSTAHLVSLLDEFRQRDVAFRFLEQGIDTTTAEGRMVYRMLAAVAEFQRDLIVANTNEGLAAARARGRKGGRRPKLTTHQAELAQQLYDAREKTVQEIADLFTVPRSTIYGYLNKETRTVAADQS
ncbi:recombinase family protein [Saccharopolyspora mangrovi]|uniref:Recombinase family protein n=1 Tax=Saccharopolyspora mangrovi TaxID=3082379 RepID=A0ABU6AE00_9PSEU|nr:recombinase family protein [Saccharopolyspora sp. S2-29]MEB3369614.1 recombinase family protein [Saccharopolyspora sp. S2-29]